MACSSIEPTVPPPASTVGSSVGVRFDIANVSVPPGTGDSEAWAPDDGVDVPPHAARSDPASTTAASATAGRGDAPRLLSVIVRSFRSRQRVIFKGFG